MSDQTGEYTRQRLTIRKNILDMVHTAGSGHIGGSLSLVEILTVLYFSELKIDPERPDGGERDRLVLSKGHASPVMYSVLAERGFFPRELLKDFRQIESPLSGHVEMNVPGVDMSTGSLGQGLSVAVGMALAGRSEGRDYRVFCILGDGELEEGQIWEAAMCGGHFQLDNLAAIVDNNGLQIDGPINQIMSSYPIVDKFKAFNWHVISVDGHDIAQIKAALAEARQMKSKPTVIVARTVKGKGVSFMENNVAWHGKATSDEQHQAALEELSLLEEEGSLG